MTLRSNMGQPGNVPGDALLRSYDALLLDLDGVVYRGQHAVPYAPEVLVLAHESLRLAYVTNNASRTPESVAAHLAELGLPATEEDVVTSAQAGAALLSTLVPRGSSVLVVGGEGLEVALRAEGLEPVRDADSGAMAVIQGHSPDTGWRILAEATFALRAGLPWVATNTDMTFPTERGAAPGNGQFVEVLARTTGRAPVVAGKPYPTLMEHSVRRVNSVRPLVVGDRLDTDIAGAVGIGADSLLVLTGISTLAEACQAGPESRPTYISADLRGLLEPAVPVTVRASDSRVTANCGRWLVAAGADGSLSVVPAEPAEPGPSNGMQALAAACWAAADSGWLPSGVEAAAERVLAG